MGGHYIGSFVLYCSAIVKCAAMGLANKYYKGGGGEIIFLCFKILVPYVL